MGQHSLQGFYSICSATLCNLPTGHLNNPLEGIWQSAAVSTIHLWTPDRAQGNRTTDPNVWVLIVLQVFYDLSGSRRDHLWKSTQRIGGFATEDLV
jgi:hypothetical protein